MPPGTGICHQVNLEYLAQTVWTRREARRQDGEFAFPDTLVGTDSHTTMINGLAVLGWGVGGIEAEAAMLGQPISMLIPEVIGFKLHGELREGVTATDLVLTVTQMLRKKGVVGKFVEFYGPGLDAMTVADRATHRQHGAGIWRDLRLLPDRRRDAALSCRTPAASLRDWRWSRNTPRRRACIAPRLAPIRSSPTRLSSTSTTVAPSIAGPKRPQDRVALSDAKAGVHRRDDQATSRRTKRSPSATRSREQTTISAMATW